MYTQLDLHLLHFYCYQTLLSSAHFCRVFSGQETCKTGQAEKHPENSLRLRSEKSDEKENKDKEARGKV